jgi:predicted acyl esterase
MHARILLACGLVVLAARADAAPVGSVFGGRVPCGVDASSVQFCQGGSVTHDGRIIDRVESWDGIPLDCDVTLPPPATDGPFPLIIELHGWSLGKTDTPFVTEATAGYAVMSCTARGFHGSCGSAMARAPDATLANPNACAERGWTRLADVRYEAHDNQYLAGLLVDDGLVVPDKIGVTGASYGGGQSYILAALRNRVMMPDGTLVPWRSPGGRDMAIAAAAPQIGWTDLAESLTPAGRTLDYRTDNPYGTRAGVQKQSWNDLLYDIGLATGYYAPAGADPEADLTGWNDRLKAGEPYDNDPTLVAALDEITAHHSAYYVDDSVTPAPLFVYNSWTDDLFGVDEALRYYRKVLAHHPDARIALHFEANFGHPRADLGANGTRITDRVMQHFALYLKGTGDPIPPIETFTQACGGATEAGPFTATDWDALRPGEVRLESRARRHFVGGKGDLQIRTADDPLAGGPCRTIPATDDSGAASYMFPRVRGKGFTLMGAPTLIARLVVHGHFAQVVARLWDVGPDGMQTLVTHAIYRPRSDNRNPQPFQLHPNGWHFAAGHRPKVELVGGSVPYARLVQTQWSVAVERLQVRLPVVERPGGIVRAQGRPVLPPKAVEPPDTGS